MGGKESYLKAKLILEDGSFFDGFSFGYHQSSAGEVVFCTGMVGYPQSLTDPSYAGQILVFTYPLIGNYGIHEAEKDEHDIPLKLESDLIHVKGLIVSEYSVDHNHWHATKSLAEWLHKHKIPALFGIDTRALTLKIRERGVMLGKIIINEQHTDFHDPNTINLVDLVSRKEVTQYGSGKHKIIVVDCGIKNNIIRSFLKRDVTIKVVPWDYDYTNEEFDGLFISNGPGDPTQCTATIDHIRKTMEQKKPIFGICLGHQLLALAAGGRTYKLKYGHRGQNQPCVTTGNRAYITSQNHGFAVDKDSLPEEWEELFYNANDGTNEGIRHKTLPFFSTQFHPEAFGGPRDTEHLFDEFIAMIEKRKQHG